MTFVLAPGVNRDDAGVDQLGGRPSLDNEPVQVGLFAEHHLESDEPPRLPLSRLVDDAHAAAAQFPQQLVIAETLHDDSGFLSMRRRNGGRVD